MIVVSTVSTTTVAATRRLVDAVHHLHPDATTVVAVLDDDQGIAADTGTDAVVEQLELFSSRADHDRTVGRCSPEQLAAVALPLVAAAVAGHRHRPVVAAAPSIEVVDRLDGLLPGTADETPLVVVPRADSLLPHDDRHPDETDLATAGRFLTTLFGAGAGADSMLRWWAAEAARTPDRIGSLLESAVLIGGATVCRDPHHGVNGARASTPGTAAPATIDTSGRSRRSPHLFSAADGPNPRLLLSEHANLAAILAERDARVDQPEPTIDRFSERCRLVYAEAMRVHELAGGPEPPSPVDADAFRRWLTEPAAREDGLNNLLQGLWATRIDLRAAFPDPDLGPAARERYLEWVRHEAPHQEGIPADLIPPPATPEPPSRARRLPRRLRRRGANVAGFVDADLGVGEIARLVIRALEQARIGVTVQTVSGTANRRRSRLVPADEAPVHDTDIVCVNADRIAAYLDARGAAGDPRHTVGVFFWETDVLTPAMSDGLARVDEVWAGSTYVADQFAPATDAPVEVLPVPVLPPPPRGDGRALLDVEPGRPVLFFTFDHHSSARRKNVDGLIRAFRDAFSRDEGPVLVCKSINGDRLPAERERLVAAAGGRPDIRLVDGYVDAGELSAMIAEADAYVSLHRSEGFGLTVAHAMALGTPVVTTAGSGPADFCDESTALIVPGHLVPIGADAPPYPAEGRWLDPDHDAAVAALRSVVSDPTAAAGRAERARASIAATHGLERTVRFLQEHIR